MTDTASSIVTPEAVVLDFHTAGVGSRCIAKLLDLAVMIGAAMLVGTVVSMVFGIAGTGEWVAAVLMAVATFLILFGYSVVFEVLWSGKTLGKAALGLRVVTREGAPVKFRHAATRSVIGLVEIFALPFIAVLSCALSRNDQRVGDLAAGTIVIRERTAVDHAISLRFVVPPGYEQYVETLDVSGLDERQYEVIRSFLTRVLKLSPDARLALAFRLANPVALAMDHEPPAGIGPEVFLACVATAYQLRRGGHDTSWGQGWDPWAPQGGWGQAPNWAPQAGWGAQPAWDQAGYGYQQGWGPQAGPAAAWAPPPPAGWSAPPPPPTAWSAPPPPADPGSSASGYDPPA